jgi:hypothetical protein
MNGRALTGTEQVALRTCNAWLRNKLRGTLGQIDPENAVFVAKPKRLELSWIINASAGTGGGMCATDALGFDVIGAVIDGLEVQP